MEHSKSVRIEGHWLARHGDLMAIWYDKVNSQA